MYTIQMPIGDWGASGHAYCDYYLINSDYPVECVREAHFEIKEKTGLNIEGICNGYRERTLKLEDKTKLYELGFKFNESANEELSSQDIRDIWIFLLNVANPMLNIELIGDLPAIPFLDRDEKVRYIDNVGYGITY